MEYYYYKGKRFFFNLTISAYLSLIIAFLLIDRFFLSNLTIYTA